MYESVHIYDSDSLLLTPTPGPGYMNKRFKGLSPSPLTPGAELGFLYPAIMLSNLITDR